MAEATLKEIREFFGMDMPTFKREWLALTAQDKAQIKAGLSDGTLTYCGEGRGGPCDSGARPFSYGQ